MSKKSEHQAKLALRMGELEALMDEEFFELVKLADFLTFIKWTAGFNMKLSNYPLSGVTEYIESGSLEDEGYTRTESAKIKKELEKVVDRLIERSVKPNLYKEIKKTSGKLTGLKLYKYIVKTYGLNDLERRVKALDIFVGYYKPKTRREFHKRINDIRNLFPPGITQGAAYLQMFPDHVVKKIAEICKDLPEDQLDLELMRNFSIPYIQELFVVKEDEESEEEQEGPAPKRQKVEASGNKSEELPPVRNVSPLLRQIWFGGKGPQTDFWFHVDNVDTAPAVSN